MVIRVYLDQNVISGLRTDKENQSSWAPQLKETLASHNFLIHYSRTTLEEIWLSGNQDPYLDVLKSLGAKYCYISENSDMMSISDVPLEEVWVNYTADREMLSDLGISEFNDGIIDYLKIALGCNTGKDLFEGSHDLFENINDLIERSADILNDALASNDDINKHLKLSRLSTPKNIDHLKGVDHRRLHPDNLRRSIDLKGRDINNLSYDEILLLLRPLINDDILNGEMPEKALSIYMMLNALGYKNDDYTRKRGARLLPSIRDAYHVQASIYLDAIITSDKNLQEKAKVIYQALGIRTAGSYSPEQFLEIAKK